MEDNIHPIEALRPASQGGSAQERGVSTDLAPNESGHDTKEENTSTEPRKKDENESKDKHQDKTIIFKNHLGDRYVWPFEYCRSFDSIKPLLEEIYTRVADQDLVEEVEKGRYDIQTDDGATILPTVWNFIVKPYSTIKIFFPSRNLASRRPSPIAQSYPESRRSPSPGGARLQDGLDEVEVVIDRSHPLYISPIRSEIEAGESDSDAESLTLTESEDEVPEQPPLPEPPRDVVPPIDAEGNKLSFKTNTAYARPWQQRKPGGNKDTAEKPKGQKAVRKINSEGLRITKAMAVEDEGKSMVKIYTLPDPESATTCENIGIRWYHLHSEQLSFPHFMETCLAVPGLSERSKMLIRKTFSKIEKEKARMALDGMFIEPGTVLRGDEDCQSDPHSVIFCCVPYFDLQPALKKAPNGHADRLCAPKTLIQAYYPYEPVRERDLEQAYRKFGDDHSNRLIHVPNLWVMNIGSHAVVTCGHQPLTKEFVKSIEVVPEDLQPLRLEATTGGTDRIRLKDWDGRMLHFSLEECRSFFQMEQRLREVKYSLNGKVNKRDLELGWITTGGEKKVTPLIWTDIIKQNGSMFIDLTVSDKDKTKKVDNKHIIIPLPQLLASSTLSSSVPPFFHWPQTTEDCNQINQPQTPQGLILPDVKRAIHCLEQVDKAMMSETLNRREADNAVGSTFTSTSFYQGLQEDTSENVRSIMASLLRLAQENTEHDESKLTHHQFVIYSQCAKIAKMASEFFQIVNATFKLFVEDVDKSTVLRKVWGAMASMYVLVVKSCQLGDLGDDPAEYSDPNQTHAELTKARWFIRPFSNDPFSPDPEADEKLKQSLRRCRPCRHLHAYRTPQAALEHLQKHLEPASLLEQEEDLSRTHRSPNLPAEWVAHSGTGSDDHQRRHLPMQSTQRDILDGEKAEYSTSSTELPRRSPPAVKEANQNLKDRILSLAQLKREQMDASSLRTLHRACQTARELFIQARELAEGVMNEDKTMSELYHLPNQLLEAFRQIVVFYLAVERALFYTEASFLGDGPQSDPYSWPYQPEQGLTVVERFGDGAWCSLADTRRELCKMVMSKPPRDVFKRLSLGPEYLCSWFMRRLLVKPLEKSMTVADMYREYLSTIQFQVNHRPGKRLLRSITLLHEELLILRKVNSWQTKAITNYMFVLDDATYEKDIPSRRGMFPYERMLLNSCLESLALANEEYVDQINRCGPLSETTKQSLEINEEDHGKAIMVFTIVTIIFLPLSFVTSYFGMNSSDLRDMESGQSLFWIVAVPLTVFTMSSIMLIGYNGDELRDLITSIYRTLTGKHRGTSARGISVAQRKDAHLIQGDSSSMVDRESYADSAEFASPRPEYYAEEYSRPTFEPEPITTKIATASYSAPASRPVGYSVRSKPPIHYNTSMNTRRETRYNVEELRLLPPMVRMAEPWAEESSDEERRNEYTWEKKHRKGASARIASLMYAEKENTRTRERFSSRRGY